MSDSVILRPNAIFAVVAYDEGEYIHAKTVWNPAFDYLSKDGRERVFIAVQDATNEAMFKQIRKAKK
jgi:hypothetical protein